MITQTFDLNLIPDSAPVVVHCDQYDKGTGRLVISLYDGSIAYSPSGTAAIQGTKPDGHGFDYACTMSGNVVTADLTEQMTAVAGQVRTQIVVTESTGRTGTFVFILDVQRSALPSDTDMSESDYQLIEQAIEDAQAAVTDAEGYSEDAEAWAVGERGGVPVTSGDDTYHNNSKYWADIASQYAQGGLHYKGSCTFANIPTTGMDDGDMWNIEDDFTTDSRFREGAGVSVAAGTNIAWISSISKWDVLAVSKIGSLDDLNDVDISTIKNGMFLAYNATSSKWVNRWIDALIYDPTSLDDFVNQTADWNEGHNFAKFFRMRDDNNVFGLGTGWYEGYVIYQNNVASTYNKIGGYGNICSYDTGIAYQFIIGGGGTVSSPYTLTTKSIGTDMTASTKGIGKPDGITTDVNNGTFSAKGVGIVADVNSSGTQYGSNWLYYTGTTTVITPESDKMYRVTISGTAYLYYWNGTAYAQLASSGGGGGASLVDVTTAQYNALTPAEKADANTWYWINDMDGNAGSYIVVGSLTGLTDTNISSPQNGQVLKYNSTSQKWENANESGGGGGVTSFNGRTGAVTPANGDYSLAGLSDTFIGTPAHNNILTYISGLNKWSNEVFPFKIISSGSGGGGGTIAAQTAQTNEQSTTYYEETGYHIIDWVVYVRCTSDNTKPIISSHYYDSANSKLYIYIYNPNSEAVSVTCWWTPIKIRTSFMSS